jgi:hypothetical protein
MLADGTRTKISDSVTLHVRLFKFSWDHEFKIQKEGPFPGIVGMDILSKTQMIVELPPMTYRFAFAPKVRGAFLDGVLPTGSDAFLQRLRWEVVDLQTLEPKPVTGVARDRLMKLFMSLFTAVLGTATCAPYDVELTDSTPVRSPHFEARPQITDF